MTHDLRNARGCGTETAVQVVRIARAIDLVAAGVAGEKILPFRARQVIVPPRARQVLDGCQDVVGLPSVIRDPIDGDRDAFGAREIAHFVDPAAPVVGVGAGAPFETVISEASGEGVGTCFPPEQIGPRPAVDGVVARGKAELGDKTMIDALSPALDAWDAAAGAGATPTEAARAAAEAAARGRDATAPLVARKGRASYLGPRSVGHQDPGATSSHLLLRAAAERFG